MALPAILYALPLLLFLGDGGSSPTPPPKPKVKPKQPKPGECVAVYYGNVGLMLGGARDHACAILVIIGKRSMLDDILKKGDGCPPILATADPEALKVMEGQMWNVSVVQMVDGTLKTKDLFFTAGTTPLALGHALKDARKFVAEHCKPIRDDPTPLSQGAKLAALVAALTTDEPTPGFLYQVVRKDNPSKVARRALNVPVGDPRVAPYLRAMVQSRYNWTAFATQPHENSGREPGYFGGGEVEGIWGDISAAYLEINESPQAAFLNGHWPQRLASFGRGPNNEYFLRNPTLPMASAGTYGLVFLPQLGADSTVQLWGTDDTRASPDILLNEAGVPLTGPDMTRAVYDPYILAE